MLGHRILRVSIALGLIEINLVTRPFSWISIMPIFMCLYFPLPFLSAMASTTELILYATTILAALIAGHMRQRNN